MEQDVNNDIIQGIWRQLGGQLKRKWGKLTDDDILVAVGSREYLSGKIQERYGVAKQIADEQVREFEKKLLAAF